MGTNEEKELIRKAMLEPEMELPSDFREEMTPDISAKYNDHQILNDNLYKHLGSINTRFDQNALSDEVFRKRLLNVVEKVQFTPNSGFFFKMRAHEFIKNIREKMFYSQYAPYKWAPVGLIILFIIGSLPLLKTEYNPFGDLAYKENNGEMKDWMGVNTPSDKVNKKSLKSKKIHPKNAPLKIPKKAAGKKRITRIASRSRQIPIESRKEVSGDFLEEDPNLNIKKRKATKKGLAYHPGRATLIKAKKSFDEQKNKSQEKKLLDQLKKANTSKAKLIFLKKLEKFYKDTSNNKKMNDIKAKIKKLQEKQ